jgi:aminopeptidase N
LFEAAYIAQANAANANGKGDAILMGAFPTYFDIANIDSVNDPALKTYMLSLGSMAMVSKAFNPDVPETTFDFIRYTMRSAFMPELVYDVWYNNKCKEGQSRRVEHSWTIRLTADIFQNPQGCQNGNTGVLAFKCV